MDEEWLEETATSRCMRQRGVKRRQGSIEDVIARQHLPPGPSNLQELMQFPEHMVWTVFERADFKSRVLSLLQHGVCESSDYSGVFAEGEAKRLMFRAIERQTGFKVPHVATRTCDIDSSAQATLVHISDVQERGNMCVFPDIRQQVHQLAQDWLDGCAPGPEATQDQQAQAYEAMHDWLRRNGSWAVNQDR
ncbi:unnamed protein product [Symbiodinium sp. CCMP2592]|nr:unnamed protein product [Symbiodinium sp. CCMP2592]